METNSNIVVEAGAWAIEVPQSEASAIATLRLRSDVLACLIDGSLWLRGTKLDDELDGMLQRLAPARRYSVDNDGNLIPVGRCLPVGRLPGSSWIPLRELIVPARTPAALTGQLPGRVGVTLQRTPSERPATLLRTTLGAWVRYVETAPLVRLRPLHFAASTEEALIRGTPLPPLPGSYYYESAGIAVPCGFDWSPPVDAETLRAVLQLDRDDLAVFDEAGRWQRLPATRFVRATRSAARLTLRGIAP